MAAQKLTKNFVDSIPYKQKSGEQSFYFDTDLKGFGLRVGAETKTYFVEGKVNGKTVRVTIGRHGVYAPEEARKFAIRKLGDLAQHINPNQVQKDERARSITLQDACDEYLSKRDLKQSTLSDYRKCMNKYFSDWLNKPLQEITRDLVEARHSELSERSPSQANMSMRFLRAVFNFAADHRDSKGQSTINDNPVKRLSARKLWNRSVRRDGYIQPHQIKPWWEALWAIKNDAQSMERESIRDYLIVLILTGLRRGEALSLRWDDIDFKATTLTITDTKNRDKHILPLSDYLLELFKRRKKETNGEWVFPSFTGSKGHITDPHKQIANVSKASGVQFSSHDLRRTFASIVNILGDRFSYYTVKRLLNHRTPDVTAGYIQHNLDKLREAMQAVTDYVLANAEANDTQKNTQKKVR